MKISIIIPVINEQENLRKLLPYLKKHAGDLVKEIIVVDGGSSDNTREICSENQVHFLSSPKRTRAIQMNYGANNSNGEILYFIHADSCPPATFASDIIEQIQAGYKGGTFRAKYNSNHPLLKINSFFTRFKPMWCRGGDHSLFFTREVFEELGRYPEDHIIMEEYAFLNTFTQKYPLAICKSTVICSARKYEQYPYLKVNIANLTAFKMYKRGEPQEKIFEYYNRVIWKR